MISLRLGVCLFFALCGADQAAAGDDKGDITDKTLVAWVAVDKPDVVGGSALTLGQGDDFDGLVFAERTPGKWSAGSEFWHRSPANGALASVPDATAGKFVQVALVHQGMNASLFLDGKQAASWTMKEVPPAYNTKSYVMFGKRHRGAADANCYFSGEIEDARIYSRALTADELTALKPKEKGAIEPYAWWDFEKDGTDKMGAFPYFETQGHARIEGGRLHLAGAGDYLSCVNRNPAISEIQFRPHEGNFADPIPIFWKGQYHVFYLQGGIGRVPWQHIVSTDLVHWKQLPTALRSDGAPDSWDGGNMFTGSVIEHDGKFYCYYTGDNGANPLGNEGVRLATSDDLVKWTKQPDFLVVPDGTIYSAKRTNDNPDNKMIRDFRDPYPYKIPGKNEWWMILCANDAPHGPGVYTSGDLLNWKPAPPLDAELQECPDLFKVGDTYYLMGADHYAFGTSLRGKFTRPGRGFLDRPGIYAGKRMWDGKRNIFVGWIADLNGFKDGGKLSWGGTMCSPRELVPGPGGVLYVRPAQEVIDAYSEKVLDLTSAKSDYDPAQWAPGEGTLASSTTPAKVLFDVPLEGMLEMKLKVSPDSKFTVSFRADPSRGQGGYSYTYSPATSTLLTQGQGADWSREGCKIDTTQPVTIRAILRPETIEFFLNDEYASTRRAYDLKDGKLALEVDQGSVTLQDLGFRQMPKP